MKIVEQKVNDNPECKSLGSINGYYLVSIKWSVLSDEYITFVRKSTIAYCYNLDWAGPKNIYELDQLVEKDKTIIVQGSVIEPFLNKVCIENKVCFVLPNTLEVRKAIGFKDLGLKLSI